MTESIRPGRYRHFKGGEYRVLFTARHSETEEPMVVYQPLYGEGGYWVRPLSMWNQQVERDGYCGPRFRYIGEEYRLNIQIFGKSTCFDTKKAARSFKERRIKFQSVDLKKYGMSKRELTRGTHAEGLAKPIPPNNPDAPLLQYLAYDADKLEKLLDDPTLLRTPIVRNGKQATVGYCPEVWETWT